MRSRCGKHSKQMGSEGNRLITVSAAPYNGPICKYQMCVLVLNIVNRYVTNVTKISTVMCLFRTPAGCRVILKLSTDLHIFDLVIYIEDDNLIKSVSVPSMLPDHIFLNTYLFFD